MTQFKLHPGPSYAAAMIALCLNGCTGGEPSDGVPQATRIRVTDAWIPALPPGATVFAGYLTLENTGSSPVLITGARSPRFQAITLHRTVIEGDVARMLHEPSIPIAARTTVRFTPGGHHLMMLEPLRPIEERERIEVVLSFGDGTESSFQAAVRPRSGN